MSSGGYLAPPDEKPANAELWIQTWNMLDRFQPGLFAELFPEEAKKPRLPRKANPGKVAAGATDASPSPSDTGAVTSSSAPTSAPSTKTMDTNSSQKSFEKTSTPSTTTTSSASSSPSNQPPNTAKAA